MTQYCIVREGNLKLFHIQSIQKGKSQRVCNKALQETFLKVLIMSLLQLYVPLGKAYKSYSMEILVSNGFGLILHYIIYSLNIHFSNTDSRKRLRLRSLKLQSARIRELSHTCHNCCIKVLLDQSSSDTESSGTQISPQIKFDMSAHISSIILTVQPAKATLCGLPTKYQHIKKMTTVFTCTGGLTQSRPFSDLN